MYDISGFPICAYCDGYCIMEGTALGVGIVAGRGEVRDSADDGRELALG